MTRSDTRTNHCPLCGEDGTKLIHCDARRVFLRCGDCQLVFVPRRYHLPPAVEKAHYDLHQNDPGDANYRRFLGRLFHPLTTKLRPGSRGLDFGSGPGPTLSVMLAEAEFPTAIYDPFYAPHEAVWSQRYDFVTASEVVEHLHRPMTELQRLWAVLKPGGWLGIMTKRVTSDAAFITWHYKNDPTHVAFFAEETFVWLAAGWSAKLEFSGPDVVLLKKPMPSERSSSDESTISDSQPSPSDARESAGIRNV